MSRRSARIAARPPVDYTGKAKTPPLVDLSFLVQTDEPPAAPAFTYFDDPPAAVVAPPPPAPPAPLIHTGLHQCGSCLRNYVLTIHYQSGQVRCYPCNNAGAQSVTNVPVWVASISCSNRCDRCMQLVDLALKFPDGRLVCERCNAWAGSESPK